MKAFEQRGHAILRRLPPKGRAAEIGVLIGALSEFLLANNPGLHLTMVDSWAPADQQPECYKATGDVHAHHDAARANLHRRETISRVSRFRQRIRILDMTSTSAARMVEDGSLDLVFLDADHSYDGVKADLAAWLPKVKPGGWIGGHDYRNPDPAFRFEVDRAVDEWAASTARTIELDRNFTWFARV